MATRRRLDAEMLRRKMVSSRGEAATLIHAQRVFVQGILATKPARQVTPDVSIRISEPPSEEWASRGAYKLLGALERFEPQGFTFAGKRVLDAGASTGGFTDVALRRNAREVVAVDVGYGQLTWRLHNDPRVRVVDRTNIRHITPELCGGYCDVMVGDLSFISLKTVLPAVLSCLTDGADIVPMVKPQFEIDKHELERGGVVHDPRQRTTLTAGVAKFAQGLGLSLKSIVASPLPGPSGNVEYFLWLIKDNGQSAVSDSEVQRLAHRAVVEGPQ